MRERDTDDCRRQGDFGEPVRVFCTYVCRRTITALATRFVRDQASSALPPRVAGERTDIWCNVHHPFAVTYQPFHRFRHKRFDRCTFTYPKADNTSIWITGAPSGGIFTIAYGILLNLH